VTVSLSPRAQPAARRPSHATVPAPARSAPEPPLWTVTIDHGGDPLGDDFDARHLDALVRRLGRRVAAVSHRPHRFTTTIRLHGADALAAATEAARLVEETAREVGLPAWPLVHVEVERRG
jgi:hypothetical protein